METQVHHGKAVAEIAKQKGFNKIDLANALNITRQGLEYHLKKAYWNRENLEEFAKVLEVNASEITSKKTTIEADNTYLSLYIKTLQKVDFLQSVLIQNGIRVEIPNFNLVSSLPRVGGYIFLPLLTWLLTMSSF